MIHRTVERAEADFVRRNFSGQRHGHICTTVEATAKRNHARSSGMGASNFHRVFHRFRTGSEECGFSLPAHWGKGVNFLRQRDVAFVRHNLIRRVGKLLQLLLHRRDQIRWRCPVFSTAMPAAKSMYSLPSTSFSVAFSADWAKKLHITPTPRGVAERRR